MITYGDGRNAPPAGLPRESIELQRVGSRIAFGVRNSLSENRWINIEADISPALMRLVFHYVDAVSSSQPEPTKTLEINIHPGHPIDDAAWIDTLIKDILGLIKAGESDLIIPQPLDYIRLCDITGK